MAIYVDDMHLTPLGRFGRMQMCHMIADTDDELHAMAVRIGIAHRHFQSRGTARRHYDVCASMRKLAVANGAVEVTLKQAAAMTARRKWLGVLGQPGDEVQWVRQHSARVRCSCEDLFAGR